MEEPLPPSLVSVSVVVPAFNEEGNLLPLWEALRPVLDGLHLPWELILVDDGSTDGGPREMVVIQEADPRVRVLRLDERQGQSAAFWCGFQAASGEVVVTLDADLQNDPEDIPLLLDALRREAAHAAIGWRWRRSDPLVKRLTSRFANWFRNRVTGESIHDVGCSLKAFRREALGHLPPFRGMHRFYPTLIRFNGLKVVEVQVKHRPRVRGRSKYGTWNRLLGPFLDCLAVRWMKSRHLGSVSAKEVHGKGSLTRNLVR